MCLVGAWHKPSPHMSLKTSRFHQLLHFISSSCDARTTTNHHILPSIIFANAGTNDAASNSSWVSLDNLKCVCCLTGHVSDENDLLLCDGSGCYRAYHTRWVKPPWHRRTWRRTKTSFGSVPYVRRVAIWFIMLRGITWETTFQQPVAARVG